LALEKFLVATIVGYVGASLLLPKIGFATKDKASTPKKIRIYPEKNKGLVRLSNGQWCDRIDISEADGITYCTHPLSPGELAAPWHSRSRPLRTDIYPQEKPSYLPSKDVRPTGSAPHLTNPGKPMRLAIA